MAPIFALIFMCLYHVFALSVLLQCLNQKPAYYFFPNTFWQGEICFRQLTAHSGAVRLCYITLFFSLCSLGKSSVLDSLPKKTNKSLKDAVKKNSKDKTKAAQQLQCIHTSCSPSVYMCFLVDMTYGHLRNTRIFRASAYALSISGKNWGGAALRMSVFTLSPLFNFMNTESTASRL